MFHPINHSRTNIRKTFHSQIASDKNAIIKAGKRRGKAQFSSRCGKLELKSICHSHTKKEEERNRVCNMNEFSFWGNPIQFSARFLLFSLVELNFNIWSLALNIWCSTSECFLSCTNELFSAAVALVMDFYGAAVLRCTTSWDFYEHFVRRMIDCVGINQRATTKKKSFHFLLDCNIWRGCVDEVKNS